MKLKFTHERFNSAVPIMVIQNIYLRPLLHWHMIEFLAYFMIDESGEYIDYVIAKNRLFLKTVNEINLFWDQASYQSNPEQFREDYLTHQINKLDTGDEK